MADYGPASELALRVVYYLYSDRHDQESPAEALQGVFGVVGQIGRNFNGKAKKNARNVSGGFILLN
jgi:hypothetical protein